MPKNIIFQSIMVIACFAVFGASLLVHSVRNPSYNWDMIPYVAAAKSLELHDSKMLHQYTYSSLKESVPAAAYKELTSGDYRKTMSEDSAAFEQQMPFYKIKVLYVVLIFLFYKIGVNIFVGTYLISALALITGLFCFYGAFRRHMAPLYFLPVLYCAFLLNISKVAQLSTPDGLAFLAFAAIVYFFMQEKHSLFIMLPLSLFVRTDLLIFAGLVLFYTFVQYPKWRLFSVLSFIASSGIYWAINAYFGNYGWNTLISFSFLETVALPSQIADKIHIADYFDIVFQQAKKIIHENEFQLYIGMLLFSLVSFLSLRKQKEAQRFATNKTAAILFLTLMYAGAHFLLFPSISLRFYMAPYIVGVFGFIYFTQSELRRQA